MSKEQKSKLDAHAERLDEWFGIQKLTIEEVQKQLTSDGVSISQSRLSTWWANRQQVLLQNRLLDQIATGARQCKDLEKQFGENPAPEMELIMRLNRVLVMQLSTQAQADPALLQIANQLSRTVVDYHSGQTKAELEKQKIDLSSRRVQLLEKKADAYDRAQAILKNSGGITPETMSKIEAELKLL